MNSNPRRCERRMRSGTKRLGERRRGRDHLIVILRRERRREYRRCLRLHYQRMRPCESGLCRHCILALIHKSLFGMASHGCLYDGLLLLEHYTFVAYRVIWVLAWEGIGACIIARWSKGGMVYHIAAQAD